MKRRAYIGLSGPLAYDYKNQGDKFDSRESSAPNPILEDTLGLLIYYDEIIFLCPHLCPRNMRDLPYVQYLTDKENFEQVFSVALEQAQSKFEIYDQRNKLFPDFWDMYQKAVGNVTGLPERVNRNDALYVPDNHTHQIYLAHDISVSAASARFQNVLIDWVTKDAFELENCDVISNTGTQAFYSAIAPNVTVQGPKIGVAQNILARRLPNYLTPDGPYHEAIESLRAHQFIEDMRRYLDDLLLSYDHEEIDRVSDEVVKLAQAHRDQLFQKFLSKSNEYWVLGKAALTDGAGMLIPGVGTVRELMGERALERGKTELRWAGFVTDVEGADADS